LTYNQFKQALRKPWGIMPTYQEAYTSDQTIADLQAYLMTLPKVDSPAPWMIDIRNIVPNSDWSAKPPAQDAPLGQQLFAHYGCMDCHGPEGTTIRQDVEAAGNDFQQFAKLIYTHTDRYKSPRMGDFSRQRLPESALQEIYHFLFEDLGYLVPFSATIRPGTASGENTVYTLEVQNKGTKGTGVTAENVTIVLPLAPGTKVVSANGGQGVRADPDTTLQALVWQLPSLAATEKQSYTITIAGTNGKPTELFKDPFLRWTSPGMRKGVPNLALRDPRLPGKDPRAYVTFPRATGGRAE